MKFTRSAAGLAGYHWGRNWTKGAPPQPLVVPLPVLEKHSGAPRRTGEVLPLRQPFGLPPPRGELGGDGLLPAKPVAVSQAKRELVAAAAFADQGAVGHHVAEAVVAGQQGECAVFGALA